MFTIKPSVKVIDLCVELCKHKNFNVKGYEGGSPTQIFHGKIAENAIRQELGKKLEELDWTDNGWDIEINDCKIDIKETGWQGNKAEARHNVYEHQIQRHNPDYYLCCCYDGWYNDLYICGYILKSDFIAIAEIITEGQDVYFEGKLKIREARAGRHVGTKDLKPLNEINDINKIGRGW